MHKESLIQHRKTKRDVHRNICVENGTIRFRWNRSELRTLRKVLWGVRTPRRLSRRNKRGWGRREEKE